MSDEWHQRNVSILVISASDVDWYCTNCDKKIVSKDELIFDGHGRSYHIKCFQQWKKIKT